MFQGVPEGRSAVNAAGQEVERLDLAPLPLREGKPSTVFPSPVKVRENVHRRLFYSVGLLYRWIEVILDRLVSSSLNPLYHTGTIAVFSLAVATVTGIYLFIFYRVGTDVAHESVEAIVRHPLGIGSLMRSLHRYSSDAAILTVVLHALKMFFNDRFWGARWVAWVSGIFLFGLVWITGATGYWLVWDVQAQILSVTTARFLDVLPLFGEPVSRGFLTNDHVQNFLFFVILFVHITIPLLLGIAFWIHVARLSRARFFPPRVILWVAGASLVGASLLRPALSGPKADLLRLPGVIPADFFYFFYFPLTNLSAWLGWVLVFGSGLVAFVIPWVFKGPAPARASVALGACTGCTRCYKDCPYEAIVMRPRSDGDRFKLEAVVDPAKCVGCGICVGPCDSGGILLGDQPVGVLQDSVEAGMAMLPAELSTKRVLVFTCRLLPALKMRLGPDGLLKGLPGVRVMGLPCVGALHPDIIVHALHSGADGVFVAGCIPEDCQFREGGLWLAGRLRVERQSSLEEIPEERLRVRWFSPVESARFLREVKGFQEELR